MAPRNVCPGVTVNRLVPSESISASRFAWAEADTPTTATIAPMPMAIPSADSAARRRRVRSPWIAVPNSSRGGSRARSMPAERGGASAALVKFLVPDDLAVPHLHPAREAGGDLFVVGDQHERGAVRGQLVQQRDHLAPGLRVQVAGRLVGEDDHRPLGDGACDGDALALTAR